ncbi:hypothetical protein [Methylorubrum extorquens]|uniref:hypothetical protein n=1 Tax=Methylorubrum extorquens TaxID=408 RepID=UPI0012DB57A5|nr:hypothetical protein [Methylorubrum extorquens]
MVNTWMPGAPHSPLNWRPAYPVAMGQVRRVIALQVTVAGKRIAADIGEGS